MLSEKPWKPEAVALLMAALMFSLFLGMVGNFVINHVLTGMAEPGKRMVNFITNILTFHLVAVLVVTIFLRAHSCDWRDLLGLRNHGLTQHLVRAFFVGLLLVPLALTLNNIAAEIMKLLGQTPELQPTVKVLQVSETLPKRISFAVAALLLAPLVEETLFRGVLYPIIKQRSPFANPRTRMWMAALGTSFLFSWIHFNIMTFLPLMIFALTMVFLYEKTNTLLAPILAHCLFNTMNFCTFIFEREISRWLQSLV